MGIAGKRTNKCVEIAVAVNIDETGSGKTSPMGHIGHTIFHIGQAEGIFHGRVKGRRRMHGIGRRRRGERRQAAHNKPPPHYFS